MAACSMLVSSLHKVMYAIPGIIACGLALKLLQRHWMEMWYIRYYLGIFTRIKSAQNVIVQPEPEKKKKKS